MDEAADVGSNGPSFGSNPRVGCVIVDEVGAILATGYHRGTGTAHAEVDALSKLSPAQTLGATAIVTLEPCNHTGHTGPCVDALLAAGIATVIFAEDDPGKASGHGADRLQLHGVHVEKFSTKKSTQLNHRWLTSMQHQRPYLILKWASTIDGRLAATDGSSQWITGPDARIHAHQRRQEVDAMIIGTGTALADDPSLTARDNTGMLLPHQPAPVVIGQRELSDSAKLRQHPAGLIQLDTHDLSTAMHELFERGFRSAIVEGGTKLLSAFLAAGLADELNIYLAPKLLGGPNVAIGDIGVNSINQAHEFQMAHFEQLGEDLFASYFPTQRTPCLPD